MALLHLSKTQRPLSYRRPGTGLLSKSFRRTEEPLPREARSGGSDMSEDDLGGNPVPGRRDQAPPCFLCAAKLMLLKYKALM